MYKTNSTIMGGWEVLQNIFGAEATKIALFKKLVNVKLGQKVLDLGCATGSTSIAFAGHDYLGVDIHQPSIDLAIARYANKPECSSLKFACADIFEFKSEPFDQILCAFTGHHLDDDLCLQITQELINRLKPGGFLHFIDNAKTGHDSVLVKVMHAIDRGRYMRPKNAYNQIFTKLQNCKLVDEQAIDSKNGLINYQFCYFKFEKM